MNHLWPAELTESLSRLLAEGIVARVDWAEEITSTNSRLLADAVQSAPDDLPWLLGAELQTAGRGRGNHRWWAASGSLTFSLLVNPSRWNLAPARWPEVSLSTGVAIATALEGLLPGGFGVKWPNDVFRGSRKLCGILVEPVERGPDRLVIGIGININNSLAAAPDDVRMLATSLIDEAGHAFDRGRVLEQIVRHVVGALGQLGSASISWPDLWPRYCVLTGRRVVVTAGDYVVSGVCGGVDHEGALKIATENGWQRCLGGTVRILESAP